MENFKEELKNLKTNLNLVGQTSAKGSKGDFLFKHLTRIICHLSYLTKLKELQVLLKESGF